MIGSSFHRVAGAAALAAAALCVPATASAATLVAHYEFEGDATDSTGNYDGELRGNPVFTDGVFGQALQFDGVDDDVRVLHQPFDETGFTIATFINVSPDLDNQVLIVSNSGASGASDGFRWYVGGFNNPDGRLALSTGVGGAGTTRGTGAGAVEYGQWHHVAIRVDRVSDTVEFFVDGVDVTGDNTAIAHFPNNTFFWLGTNFSGTWRYQGLMDDFRLYDGLLTDQEIASLAVIPEPASLALLGAGAALMLRRRPVRG